MTFTAGVGGGTFDYYPTNGSASYDPVLNGGSLTSLTIYETDGLTVQALSTSVVKIDDGHYRFTVTTALASAGTFPAKVIYSATGTGPVVTDTDETVVVYAFGGSGQSGVTVAEVKLHLNKTLTVDDDEIQSMIDQAEAEYVRWFGVLSGSVTERHDGGGPTVVLNGSPSALTDASYDSGATLNVTDLYLDGRIVGWNYGTAGAFTAGVVNVILTYTTVSLPAHHRGAIVADVAGYFQSTQRGGSGAEFPGEQQDYDEAVAAMPLTLWPRIQALAVGGMA